MSIDLRSCIRDVPDFPKPGILFRDISPLLANAAAWRAAIDEMAERVAALKPDILTGIESRGFLVAAPLALKLGCGFVMMRKRGKLPGRLIRHEYALEYGTDIIEIQDGAVSPGKRVVVLDDLLATGGTTLAAVALLRKLEVEVAGAAVIVNLAALPGEQRLKEAKVPLIDLIRYED